MNFRDEYKKEITELSSDDTARRIREGVMARLEKSEPSAPEAPAKKKPLPLKRIAVIGGSVAACLVIGFTVLAVNDIHLSDKFIMAPGENMTGGANPGLAGSMNAQSKPQSDRDNAGIADVDGTCGSEGKTDETRNDTGYSDAEADSNTGRDPTDQAPDSVPAAGDNSSQFDSASPTFGDYTVLIFEDGGITLTSPDETRFFPADDEYGEYAVGSTLAEDDLHEISEVFTESGERYMAAQKDDRLLLLTEELEIVGVYVIF